MTRIIVQSKVGKDGTLRLHLPIGQSEANQDVLITVESIAPQSPATLATMNADDLLRSGLVGMWADRTDIGNSQTFARRLRNEAQIRRRDS